MVHIVAKGFNPWALINEKGKRCRRHQMFVEIISGQSRCDPRGVEYPPPKATGYKHENPPGFKKTQ
jgi:hypothetical protein